MSMIGFNATTTSQRLPFRLKASWAVGAVGTVTMLIVVNIMLMYFMVTYLGIKPSTAGLIIAGTRLFDMISDPLMGFVSDRTKSRWGRRRPWMLLGALSSGLGCVILFSVPDLPEGLPLIGYLVFALIFYFGAYTLFTVPFMAMSAEMTDDYNERTSIMSYRTFFSGVAGLVGMSLAPTLVKVFGSDRGAYGLTGIVVGVIVMIVMLISVFGTSDARFTDRTAVKVRWTDWTGTLLKNRPFTMLLVIKALAITGIACSAGAGMFFQSYITGRAETGQSTLGLIQHLTTMGTIPLWLWLIYRTEKSWAMIVALVVYGAASLSWLTSGPNESDFTFVVRGIGLGIGYGGIVLVSLSMLPDTITSDFHATGLRREGLYSGLFAFIEKFTFVLAPLIVGVILDMYGFVESRGNLVQQTEEGLRGVTISIAVIPGILAFFGIPFAIMYDLSRARVLAMNSTSSQQITSDR